MTNASSPCIGVCTIDEPRALCLGCGRTLDEIAGWGGLSEPERLALMATLAGRFADGGGPALDAGPHRPQLTETSEGPGRWTGAS